VIDIDVYNECTGWGGTERYVFNLLGGIDRSRFRPHLLIPDLRPREQETFCSRFDGLDVEIEIVPYPSDRSTFGGIAHFAGYFRRRRRRLGPRLLHVNSYAPASNAIEIIGARLGGIREIVSMNHLPTLGLTGLNLQGRLLARLAFLLFDRVIVESTRNKEIALRKRLWPARKVKVIEYGIDLTSLEDRGAQGLVDPGNSSPVIGTVGRLVPQKGHRHLLEALSQLKKRGMSFSLMIVGNGPLRSELESQVEELGLSGDVSFLGHREDVYDLLSSFDIFVLPSEFEGLPFALLEAMAARRPIIASDVDGIGDAIVDEENGLLVPSKDPGALAAALERLVGEDRLRQELGNNARSAVARFDLPRMIARTEELYESLLPL
jgi:glycosyltransferase involved in cell wall biosynthesis